MCLTVAVLSNICDRKRLTGELTENELIRRMGTLICQQIHLSIHTSEISRGLSVAE